MATCKCFLLLLFLLCFSTFVEGSYNVIFENIPSTEILETLQSVSQLVKAKGTEPPSLFTLKKRAESDLPLFHDALHAYGFFDSYISLEYIGDFPCVTVKVLLSPGPCYHFSCLKIETPQGEALSFCSENEFDLQIGAPARFDTILNTKDQIKDQMGLNGYPFAEVIEQKIIVDQECKEVLVTYIVESGEKAYFGAVITKGLCKVKEAFIYKRIYWKQGELYNPNYLDCTDAALQTSGLFSHVQIQPGEIAPDGSLDMIINVAETKYRHVGIGVSYSTDESIGGLAQWTHDNLSGMGDSFSLITEASEVVKRGTLVYNRPDYIVRNQDLTFSFELRREDTPGFIDREVSVLTKLGRKINEELFFSYGARYERLLSTKSDRDENYNLFSFPIHILADASHRILDRTRGYYISYWGIPYKAIVNSDIFFFKQELIASFYQPLWCSPEIILAFSAQVGSIVGQSRIFIPAPKRFYAGSATGLRGYKYLTVSPLDGTKPIGGRSLLILQVEPRIRIIDKLYFATFYEMGNVYEESFPRLSEKFLRSYGVGLRYFTPVGAFRLDVGFPLDKRKGIDKTFQIYASIGQTF